MKVSDLKNLLAKYPSNAEIRVGVEGDPPPQRLLLEINIGKTGVNLSFDRNEGWKASAQTSGIADGERAAE